MKTESRKMQYECGRRGRRGGRGAERERERRDVERRG